MTDFRGLRQNIRTEAPSESQTGVGGLIAWSLACVVAGWVAYSAVGFLRTPFSQPLQPSVSLPTFSGDANKATPAPSVSPSQGAAIRVTPAEIAGKSADEIGKLADGVCFKRAQALHPHWSKTPRLTNKLLNEFHLDDMDHFNTLMQCLLTEAPQRYCTASQRGIARSTTISSPSPT